MNAPDHLLKTSKNACINGGIHTCNKGDQRRDALIKDYEHAEDINARVSDNRADPEWLRKYDDAGWSN